MGRGCGKGGLVRYNPDTWFGFALLFQSYGSVVKESIPTALVTGFMVAILQLVEYGPNKEGKDLTFAFSVVSFAFTFSLVPRMAVSYTRFWEGRLHLSTWTSRTYDLALYCKCFPKKPDTMHILGVEHKVNKAFQEEMSRLLRIYTGICLQQMQEDPWDPMQEWESAEYQVHSLLTNSEMVVLSRSDNRALTVMSWLMDDAAGFPDWNVPAPTKTRFHQQASEAMLAFSQCMKIVDTTIPFPMLQISIAILCVFSISWPFLISMLVKKTFWGVMIGFVPISAFSGVNSVALELQDPFGDDANDLPLPQIHAAMSRDIRILLEPWNVDFTETDAPGVLGPQADNEMFMSAGHSAAALDGSRFDFRPEQVARDEHRAVPAGSPNGSSQ